MILGRLTLYVNENIHCLTFIDSVHYRKLMTYPINVLKKP
jgi:hypothetical protein